MESNQTRLKDITAVVNHKGGVAKTSTVMSLAGGLLRVNRKLRVLMIDMDDSGNLSMLCGWDAGSGNGRPTIYDALRKDWKRGIPVYKSEQGLYFTPASKELTAVKTDLHDQDIPKAVLFDRLGLPVVDYTGEGLTNIVDSFDYILIDCPPSLDDTTSNAIVVASRVLIPVQLDSLSYKGLSSILPQQSELDTKLRKRLMGIDYQPQDIRIVPVMVEGKTTRVEQLYTEELMEKYGTFLSNVRIHRGIKMKEGQGIFRDIFHYAPYSRVAIDYEQLIKELYD